MRLPSAPLTSVDRAIWYRVLQRSRHVDGWQWCPTRDAYRAADRRDAAIMHALGHRRCTPPGYHTDCKTCEPFVGFYLDVAVAWLARSRPA